MVVGCGNNLDENAGVLDFSEENDLENSTEELLEAIMARPSDLTRLTPWCIQCNSLNIQGVTMFNEGIKEDKKIVELFERSDVFSVMEKKYQTVIEKKIIDGSIAYFEMILASDMCMSVLKESEKITLLGLALKKMDYEKDHMNEACHIMISIMQSCNYTKFIDDIGLKLEETVSGYTFHLEDGSSHTGLSYNHAEIIANYAKQFLNDMLGK